MKAAYILLFTMATLLASCKKETYQLNQEFTLDFDKSAIVNIDGVPCEFTFTNLEKESRCPVGVYCLAIGEVVVKIKLNNEQDALLGFDSEFPTATSYKNHTIHLLDVSYGRRANYGNEKRYSVKLRVD